MLATSRNTILRLRVPTLAAVAGAIVCLPVRAADQVTAPVASPLAAGVSTRFVANRGQAEPPVRFTLQDGRSTVFVLDDSFVWSIACPAGAPSDPTADHGERTVRSVTLGFEGAEPGARARGLDALPGEFHFFQGSDPDRWRTHVPSYGRVRTEGLYPGVALESFVGADGRFEYDLVLDPFVDPRAVVARVDGVHSVQLDDDGSLRLDLGALGLRHHAPLAFEIDDSGTRRQVPCRYRLLDSHRFTFELGTYDRRRRLVIDPPLTAFYFDYLGGSDNDHGIDLAVLNGSVYVVGSTSSFDFPTTVGAWDTSGGTPGSHNDIFVAKLAPSGALIYCTFLGSSADERAHGIEVDSLGHAYIAGTTGSHYPTTSGAFQMSYGGSHDGIVTKLSPDASALVYSTYLGGDGVDYAFDIAVDALGFAYVCGSTTSFTGPSPYPITPGVVESAPTLGVLSAPVVTKLNQAGTGLIWSTYVCAQMVAAFDPSPTASATEIRLDDSNRPTIVGQTEYQFGILPGTNTYSVAYRGGTLDALVAQLAPDATSYRFSTHFGGMDEDQGLGIAINLTNQVVVTGRTLSSNLPLVNPFDASQNDEEAFVSNFDPALTGSASLLFSTYLGGSGKDVGTGVTTDSSGRIYVCGYTSSPNEPLFQVNGLLPFSGTWDAFVTKIRLQSIAFSTYLGGALGDVSETVLVDAGGVYVVGTTQSADFYANLAAIDPLIPLVSYDHTFNGGSTLTTPDWTYTTAFPLNGTFMTLTDAYVTKLDVP